jgi:hypothetical protein
MVFNLSVARRNARQSLANADSDDALKAMLRYTANFIPTFADARNETNEIKYDMANKTIAVELGLLYPNDDNKQSDMSENFTTFIKYKMDEYISNHFGTEWEEQYSLPPILQQHLPNAVIVLYLKSYGSRTVKGLLCVRPNGFHN